MLKDDFFKIITLESEENLIKAILELNPSHAIFSGHFPAVPVVPGVCLMQMVKEIMEQVLGVETLLKKADNLKFLAVINPQEIKIIHVEVKITKQENEQIFIDAKLFNEVIVFFKMKGILCKDN
jgi:3-hydroxyacyl-[acyl-carrier-protein] dehydratase